jgi:hypothetical protein
MSIAIAAKPLSPDRRQAPSPSRNSLKRSGLQWQPTEVGDKAMKQILDPYLAAREALFRNPSDEGARAWWTSEGYAPPAHPIVPLMTVHRARLQWLDATDDMLAESSAFLFDHSYGACPNIRGYTPKTRDAQRAKLGLGPLKDRE